MFVWDSLGFTGLCHSLNWTVICRWSCSYLTAICCGQWSVWGCASWHSICTCLMLQFSPYEHSPWLNWMPTSFPPDPAWWPACTCALSVGVDAFAFSFSSSVHRWCELTPMRTWPLPVSVSIPGPIPALKPTMGVSVLLCQFLLCKPPSLLHCWLSVTTIIQGCHDHWRWSTWPEMQSAALACSQ